VSALFLLLFRLCFRCICRRSAFAIARLSLQIVFASAGRDWIPLNILQTDDACGCVRMFVCLSPLKPHVLGLISLKICSIGIQLVAAFRFLD